MTRAVPPGPPLWTLPRTLWKLARDRLGLMTAASGYGDAVRISIGPRALYFFNHPDHARHVLADNSANYHKGIGLIHARRALGDGLLTSEGTLWRRQRGVIQPVFAHRRIASQAGIVADEATRLTDRLWTHRDGEPVDVIREMTGLTLGVLGRTLLEADLVRFDAIGRSFEAVQDQAMFEMASLGLVPAWLPLPRQIRFRGARRHLRGVVGELVAERSAVLREEAGDALSRLVLSTRREADPRLAQRRLHDELVTLLLAGHETTASTLGWTFHLLDAHPEARERLRAEARDVLGDRPPCYEDLGRLRYTTMVLQEAMRLYPPVWILTRRARSDDEVGGYRVPAGSDVLISPYTLHRHPGFWRDPERFDPHRFDPDRAVDRSRYAYLPFGAGPRVCVGSQLGMLEASFVLAAVARRL
ncbi:MAG TPA: cytochrome P450, partial [Micromonosporaceae bacterium]|nr:cytochrome P450 [Micromonosporaceae bacterium]